MISLYVLNYYQVLRMRYLDLTSNLVDFKQKIFLDIMLLRNYEIKHRRGKSNNYFLENLNGTSLKSMIEIGSHATFSMVYYSRST